MENLIKKRVDKAFGKDVYLLGIDQYNEYVWLEAPKWDCGWYWGFGYVERYTNTKQPSESKDISSHTHIDSEFIDSNGIININKGLVKMTYSFEMGKLLNTLFTKFYTLRKMADGLHNFDKSRLDKLDVLMELGIIDKVIELDYEAKRKEINEVLIPKITNEILGILTP